MNSVNPRAQNSGSALISILIAALIVAILWAAKFNDDKKKKTQQNDAPDGIHSLQDVPKVIDNARKIQQEQNDRVNEMNKKLNEIDRIK